MTDSPTASINQGAVSRPTMDVAAQTDQPSWISDHPLAESSGQGQTGTAHEVNTSREHLPHSNDEPQGQQTVEAGAQRDGTTAAAPLPANDSSQADVPRPTITADDTTTAAISVRENMLRGMWNGYRALGRGRRWILILRMIIGLVQVIPAIAILSLPTSLGNSPAREPGEECDPEPIFVYLALHVVRVAASLPTDLYLSLSPHRNARQRRVGATGFAERERQRQFGSIHLDRKASKLADLLGFCHVVLFAVGNYVVWSGTECSRSPADSVPLFWTSVSMLSISYLVILNVVFLIFMVVFFLPLLLALLRALGLQHRLPTPRIRPETGKVEKQDVDKVTKLVYYTPMEEGEPNSGQEVGQEGQDPGQEQNQGQAATPPTPPLASSIPSPQPPQPQSQSQSSPSSWTNRILGRLLRLPRGNEGTGPHKRPSASSLGASAGATPTSDASQPNTDASSSPRGLKYPLHPIPSHRATCPICLCDFETPTAAAAAAAAAADSNTQDPQSPPPEPTEPEPLRLLPCNHVLHMSCVDEWLCTVSGRCPVCQKPILEEEGDATTTTTRSGEQAA